MPEDLRYHACRFHERWGLYDARGIFCTYVCVKCESAKRQRYRPEIFSDPNYEALEDIEPDDGWQPPSRGWREDFHSDC